MTQVPDEPTLKKNHAYYLEFGEFFYRVFDNTELINLGYREKNQTFKHPLEAQKQLIFEVAKWGEFQENQSILDVGCGFGGAAALIAKSFKARVTGIDVLEKHLDIAREKQCSEQVQIMFGNAMDMPFEANTFDRIYNVESAFHYQDKNQFVSEAFRVLKPGGKFVVADILQKSSAKHKLLSRFIQGGIGSPNLFDIKLYQDAAKRIGFKVRQVQNISNEVRNTLPIWIRFSARKIGKLVQHYGLKAFVMNVGFIIQLYLICSHPSFSYQILVFEKPN
jgi:ubiquinone/menaquinone biosynthesis C-methylase UbiE